MECKIPGYDLEETFSDNVKHYILCHIDKKKKHTPDKLFTHTFLKQGLQEVHSSEPFADGTFLVFLCVFILKTSN